MFQSYAIWPHMTVFDNVAYGLRVRRVGDAEIRKRVGEALDLVQMGSYAQRHASQLSGGQQQRVALARACAFSPSVLLFDEPLSNLDAKLRGDMRIELRELQRRLGVTSLYVTHDLEEALAMSDQILVMRAGRIEQSGAPDEIYNFPRTAFVADFVGSSNLVVGKADATQDGLVTVRTKDGQVILATAHGRKPGAEACVSVRTVHLHLAPDAAPAPGVPNQWRVTILRSVFLGDLTQTHVRWGEAELVVRQTGPQPWAAGHAALLSADPRHCALLEES